MRLSLLLLLAATSPLSGPPAAVHATLVSSEPAANSRVSASPPRIRLVYSEPVEGRLARVTLVPRSGQPMLLHADADPRNVNAVIAPVVDSLAAGAYRVNWRVVSADGHPVDGTFTFAVGDTTLGAAPAAAPEPPAEPALEPQPSMEDDVWGPSVYGAPLIPSLFRAAGLGALMAIAGLLLFFVRGGRDTAQSGDPRVRRVMTATAVAAPLLLAGHVLTWLVNTSPEHTLDAAWMSSALTTTVGQIELWRTGLALLALWAWWIARRPTLALTFAAAALAVSGASGHSAAMHPLFAIPAKTTHMLASGVWVGGLMWLLVRPAKDNVLLFARDAERVSGLALAAVVLVALSGVIQTLLFLPTLRDVLTSPYGWFALAKSAGLLILVGFGAYHRQRVMPEVSSARDATGSLALRASVRREIVIMVLIILLGGLLAYIPPPGEGDMSTSTREPTS